jgi:TonB family protein
LAGAASAAFGQPASVLGPEQERAAQERAQRDADKVYTWIKVHAQQEKAASGETRQAPRHRSGSAREKAGADRASSGGAGIQLESIQTPAPVMPADLRAELRHGYVQVKFTVDTSGRVVSADAVKSTHPRLARPATDAVMTWRFKPISAMKVGIADIDFKRGPQ